VTKADERDEITVAAYYFPNYNEDSRNAANHDWEGIHPYTKGEA
jgi:hypothetical protein